MTDVNPDGSQVKVEAVYWRYMNVYAEACDSIKEAVRFLESGEEYGELSSVGVFVEGQPCHVDADWSFGRGDTDEQKLKDYVKAKRSGK